MIQKYHKPIYSVRGVFFLTRWTLVADPSRKEHSAMKEGTGRATPKAPSTCSGSALFSSPFHMSFHHPGHLRALLPCVSAGPTPQGPCSHGSQAGCLPVSACTRREHQLTIAGDDMRLVLSICLVTSSYGHGATGARGCKYSLAAAKIRGEAQGAVPVTPHTLSTHASRWHSSCAPPGHNPAAHAPQRSARNGTCLLPLYLTVRTVASAGSTFQGKREKWGDDGRNVPWWQEGHWRGLQGGWGSHMVLPWDPLAVSLTLVPSTSTPAAEAVLEKGPWSEMWPMWQVAVKEDHPPKQGTKSNNTAGSWWPHAPHPAEHHPQLHELSTFAEGSRVKISFSNTPGGINQPPKTSTLTPIISLQRRWPTR